MKSYPLWILCNLFFSIFIVINLTHERVIALNLTLYDFKPQIIRHRAAKSLTKRRQHAQNSLRSKATNLCNCNRFLQPIKSAMYHIIFNIFHLDRNNMKLGLFYVWSEIKRNNFSFFIGLFTVFLSVFVGSFLPAINDKSPIVFLKLAENTVGENDMLLTAKFAVSQSPNDNSTHNETLQYEYNNEWMNGLNVDNISDILAANNISTQQLNNLMSQDLNVSNFQNLAGLNTDQINSMIAFWNANNQNIPINDFINRTTQIDDNLAALNITNGKEINWKVQVRNELLSGNALLNYTFIEEALYGVDEVSGSAPRWWLLANETAGKSEYAASSIVMAIDSALEIEAGIGRAWKNIPPLEDNEAYIMNSIVRAMNITQNNDYQSAEGSDFTMFANLGGFEDSFDMNFGAMFLESNTSILMEQNLISQGIAVSCISVEIVPNSRPNDFVWSILDVEDGNVLINGNVYQHTNDCIHANATNYIFRIDDLFGNGLNDAFDEGNDGNYTILWDDELALFGSGSFDFGSFDLQTFERPLSAYGKSKIILNETQQSQLEQILNVMMDEQTQSLLFDQMIGSDSENVMNEILPQYNATEMVQSLQNSSYNESVLILGDWLVYYIGFGAELKIAKTVQGGQGKWSSLLGAVTVIDASELSDILFNSSVQFGLAIDNLINAAVGLGYVTSMQMIKNVELMQYYMLQIGDSDLYNYAIQTIVMYTDRFDAYMGSLLNLDIHMVKFTNSVFDALGTDFPATISLPIYSQMQYLIFFKLFLNELLFSCIVLMTTLVLIVIYSLLLNDAEERTYTYGMFFLSHKLKILEKF